MPHLKDQQILPHSVDEVFEIAVDLKEYPKILTYIKAVDILSKEPNRIAASVTVGLSFISFVYRCTIRYERNKSIQVVTDFRLFKSFHANCRFEKIGADITKIDYEMSDRGREAHY